MKLVLPLLLALTCAVSHGGETAQGENAMNAAKTRSVRLTFAGGELRAIIRDTPAGDDFLAILPLTLTFRDYAGAEKIATPPRRLAIEGEPAGADPALGDLAYYAPWGNLAFFYREGGYASGLVILGTIPSGIETLAAMRGDFSMTLTAE